ncbi:MAG: DEAD/DEAH box helicase family protein [Coprococcus sp.]|uniref:DEAD/DEAH box helicase family protein n=1 Tax=Coprococcus sp. AF16-22 TaxID=2293087 RepID=UPI000E51C9CB|nr:DEAD/DEAH box helicase family protein [Coprococcus sp. AF16-22]RGH00594.1 DUF4145 domain-containing protein [Coprococcus sp. AF16-22]
MNNFDFLRDEPRFAAFAGVAISAERIILIDPDVCILNCRRAMEFAIKWIYSVETSLETPYQDNLHSLLNSEDFRDYVGNDLWRRLDYIRRKGNSVAHNNRRQGFDEAMLCLENLHIFMDFISCCYVRGYEQREFDRNAILNRRENAKKFRENAENAKSQLKEQEELIRQNQEEIERQKIDLKTLAEENADLKEKLSARSQVQRQRYKQHPLDISEFETRKLYIDAMLEDAGWVQGSDWIDEVDVDGVPSRSGNGRVDYVLYDDTQIPLAIIEAKKTCVGVEAGRYQAKEYADSIERKYGRRPVIFLTNGFETHIIDGQYPERKCSCIYSKRDLEKWFNLRSMRTSLRNVTVDKTIAGRYYQEAAIKAVCDAFDQKNRRKALLVMATGSGKTRTVIALCKILINAGWVKNILFLADRNSLVTQAKRNFVNMLQDLSCTNLVEEKNNYNARCVFSTYQTMIGCVDSASDKGGRIFTCGHFDLIICDEAHRSIYNKYKDIFTYFDAPLVGLTATPKDEVDKNTYDIFELANGVPTYGYDLAQAVEDEYLVDYMTIESKVKFLDEGIVYEELSDADKEEYEKTFVTESGDVPDKIESAALNSWLFNKDTIRKVLRVFMDNGIKIDYGQKIGKTIIFAKNHTHAEKIFEVFNEEYPHLVGYAEVIDNQTKFAQKAIDDFSDPNKLPQIAISVDMLDTGIDVPEILNLVFFKKVMSKAKFWQMIGRGTRLCEGLLDGKDKELFYIFDFCSNFEFFRVKKKGKEAVNVMPIQGAIFQRRFEIAYKLQSLTDRDGRVNFFLEKLISDMSSEVQRLSRDNRDNFIVKQHLRYLDKYSDEVNYQKITFPDVNIVKEEVSPYIMADGDEPSALRFDALIYGLELAHVAGKNDERAKRDLIKRANALSRLIGKHIDEIDCRKEIIDKVLSDSYVDGAGIIEFEEIRTGLRDIMSFIKSTVQTYDTNFDDDILSTDWHESELENDDLKNYKAKAEFYIKQHQDNIVIAKLKTNKPLTTGDVKALEDILWNEIGTRKDYEGEIGDKPLGEFVREIVGLDMNAAKEAFSEYLNETNYDSRQIYFVNQIVEYVVHNGMIKDMSVLMESPFTDRGSITDIFNASVWMGIKKVIDQINANANVA